MVDTVGDIEDLGISFAEEDFVKDQQNFEDSPEIKHLNKYLDKKGGKLSCFPLSFMQGNFAYYYVQQNQLIDDAINDIGALSSNYVERLEQSSEEEDNED